MMTTFSHAFRTQDLEHEIHFPNFLWEHTKPDPSFQIQVFRTPCRKTKKDVPYSSCPTKTSLVGNVSVFKPRYFYETSVTSFQFDVISSHFWFWSKICLFLRSNYFGISVKNFIQTQSVFEVVAEEMVASSPIFPYSITYIGVTSGMFPYWTFSIFVVPFYLALVCCVLSLEKWIFKCLLVILPILHVCSIFS